MLSPEVVEKKLNQMDFLLYYLLDSKWEAGWKKESRVSRLGQEVTITPSFSSHQVISQRHCHVKEEGGTGTLESAVQHGELLLRFGKYEPAPMKRNLRVMMPICAGKRIEERPTPSSCSTMLGDKAHGRAPLNCNLGSSLRVDVKLSSGN
ncbi:hypothetical protein Tco_0911392 [Tanacetum coccineum]|uniref:FHA domain-containing protein n=1 Tax=Tanacetum coccineum TaxID=301880 RepID=A0ABQ5CX84_9ASTR